MRYLAALAWGAILGTAAVLLHNTYPPVGIALSLSGTCVGIWILGRMWGKRHVKVVAAIGWVALVLRAASLGVGSELLVQGNWTGNALVLGGLICALIAVALPVQ